MMVKKRIAAATFAVLAIGGIGAGVANAATASPVPAAGSTTDTLTPGDTADAPGATGAADALTPGDTADAPGTAGATDGDNVQQGDQSGPDTPGAAETPGTPGA